MMTKLRTYFEPVAYPAHELPLRRRMLGRILAGATAVTLIYLPAVLLGLPAPVYFPWDGLSFLLLCFVCWLLYRRGTMGSVGLANSWLVAGVNILAAFYSQRYGVAHPVTAVYILGIILSGMLIGGWFLPLWTGMGMFFVLTWGIAELALDNYGGAPAPVQSVPELITVVLFWWTLFIISGWLVRLFARTLESAVQIARGQTAALTQTLDALVHDPAIDAILSQVLTAIAQQLQAEWATLFLYEPETDTAVLRLAYGDGGIISEAEAARLSPPPIPLSAPIVQTLRRTKEPLLLDDPDNDPRLQNRALILAQGIRAILYVPLLLGEQVIGHFTVNSVTPRRFRAEEVALAEALVSQATLALQLTRLAEQAQETAVLEERNRMAREIHDTLAQGFTGIVIQLEAAEDALADEPAAAQTHLERARALARESLAEARRSVWALRPQALAEAGLAAALRRMAARMASDRVSIMVDVTGEAFPLPPAATHELLRIAQEAVHNGVKHSQGTAVQVHLRWEPTAVRLRVEDDGRGFQPAAATDGFGLVGMRERAARIGADLHIESAPGAGTAVTCLLPRETPQRRAETAS